MFCRQIVTSFLLCQNATHQPMLRRANTKLQCLGKGQNCHGASLQTLMKQDNGTHKVAVIRQDASAL